jgi:hypothetical protein
LFVRSAAQRSLSDNATNDTTSTTTTPKAGQSTPLQFADGTPKQRKDGRPFTARTLARRELGSHLFLYHSSPPYTCLISLFCCCVDNEMIFVYEMM